MTTWRSDGGGHDVLANGPKGPPSTSARIGWTAAVCLVVGALVGAQVDDVLDDRRLASARPLLSAGVIQEAADPDGDARFAVPLYNGGSREVTVDSVTVPGWVTQGSEFRTATIRPGGWAIVPLRARVDCADIGSASPKRLTVRSSTSNGTFEQTVAMPARSAVLDDEGARLCLDPLGSVPTAQALGGSWLVEEAGTARGTLLRLRGDGTFAIDPDLYRFGVALDALGRFTWTGSELRVTAEGGHDCSPGDRAVWDVTLLLDGRLHIRHRPSRERWCGIEDGEVWIARRVPVGTVARISP